MQNEVKKEADTLYQDIKALIVESKKRVCSKVNTEMVVLYWNIGKRIMSIQSEIKSKYGEYIVDAVSKKLTTEFGKGFSKRNVEKMRRFYNLFPIASTLSTQLSWSHYAEIISLENEEEREFYMKESIKNKWDVRSLRRQIKSNLINRTSNNIVEKMEEFSPNEFIKDPYVLEFLDIKNNNYKESDLESNILNHIEKFMLELGTGFSFVGSQYRISLGGDNFYPDLVFYNRLLRCFVIIDLKIGKVTHQDIGQMQMYVNYFDRDIIIDGENQTIGILLSTSKNETVVKYTLPSDNKAIFASTYKLHMPKEEELISIIKSEKQRFKDE